MIETYTPDQRLTGRQADRAMASAAAVLTAKAQVKALLAKAEQDAALVLATARDEAGRIIRQAEQDAETATAEAARQLAEREQVLRSDLQAQLGRELATIADQLQDIMLTTFEKLVGDIGAASMVRAAVQHILRSHPQIIASRLRVAGGDAAALSDLPLDVVEDAMLGKGEAVLETGQGIIDLGRSAQLAALAALVDPERGAA